MFVRMVASMAFFSMGINWLIVMMNRHFIHASLESVLERGLKFLSTYLFVRMVEKKKEEIACNR